LPEVWDFNSVFRKLIIALKAFFWSPSNIFMISSYSTFTSLQASSISFSLIYLVNLVMTPFDPVREELAYDLARVSSLTFMTSRDDGISMYSKTIPALS